VSQSQAKAKATAHMLSVVTRRQALVAKTAAPKSTLLSLGPELLLSIGCHLKPRHLYKLMQTSKTIKAAVDTEEYWARVAVHIVFRHFDRVEIYGDDNVIFPRLSGLYDLVNLEHGYCKTIDIIIERVRKVMSMKETDKYAYKQFACIWNELANAPVTTLVRAGENAILVDRNSALGAIKELYSKQAADSMKDVVKRGVMFSMKRTRGAKRKLKKFNNDVDDDRTLTVKEKGKFMRRLADFLMDVSDETDERQRIRMDDIAFAFERDFCGLTI